MTEKEIMDLFKVIDKMIEPGEEKGFTDGAHHWFSVKINTVKKDEVLSSLPIYFGMSHIRDRSIEKLRSALKASIRPFIENLEEKRAKKKEPK